MKFIGIVFSKISAHLLGFIRALRYRLVKLPICLPCFIRILCYRLVGVDVPFSVRMGKDITIEGKVEIHAAVTLEKNVSIRGNVNIGNGSFIGQGVAIVGNVDIGEHSTIGSYTFLSTMPQGYLKIGNDVYVNSFSVLGASERVEIRDHCIFAAYVQITDAAHGFEDPDLIIKHAAFSTAPVTIEEGVWLGSAVMVMKGVTIGKGAVIGAKSLVNKNIPPLSIAYGIPAHAVRRRGESEKL